jgi:hypothetical protein
MFTYSQKTTALLLIKAGIAFAYDKSNRMFTLVDNALTIKATSHSRDLFNADTVKSVIEYKNKLSLKNVT